MHEQSDAAHPHGRLDLMHAPGRGSQLADVELLSQQLSGSTT